MEWKPYNKPKKVRSNVWASDAEPYKQLTGPQAQDKYYAESEKVIDKIPQPITNVNDEDGETQTCWWGARAEFGRCIPCDDCQNVYGVPHAMIQCYASNGDVPQTPGAGRKVAKAKEMICKFVDDFNKKTNWQPIPEDNESTASTVASSYEGVTGEPLCNICYKCYGNRFRSDENFFVNFETMRLTAKWMNKRKKRNQTIRRRKSSSSTSSRMQRRSCIMKVPVISIS